MGTALNQDPVPQELTALQQLAIKEPAISKRIVLLRQFIEKAQELKRPADALWGRFTLGMVQKEAEAYREAIATFQQGITEATALGDLTMQLNLLVQQTICYTRLNAPLKARELLDKVQQSLSQLSSKYGQAGLLLDIGFAYASLSDVNIALSFMERSARLYQKIGELRPAAQGFIYLANSYNAAGRFAQAMSTYQIALKLNQQLGNSNGEVRVLNSIATCYAQQGKPAEQLAYLKRALQVAEAHENPDVVTTTLEQIAQVYESMGDEAKATGCYERGVATTADPIKKVPLQRRLATLLMSRGAPQHALPLLLSALEAADRAEIRHWQGGILDDLIQVYGLLNQPANALKYLEKKKALERQQAPNVPEPPRSIAFQQLYLAQQQLGRQQYEEARRGLTEALATFHAENFWQPELQTLELLAQVEQATDKHQAAERAFQQAIALIERLRTDTGAGMSTQGTFFQSLSTPYTRYLTFLVGQGRVVDAFALAQKTKARGLLDLMAGGKIDINGKLTPAEKAEEQKLRQKCDQLSQAMVREAALNEIGSKKRYEAFQQELATAERELALFQDTLYAKHPGLQQRRVAQTITLEQLGKALPSDAALLEFAPLEGGQLALFVVTRGLAGRPTVSAQKLSLPTAELESRVRALRLACNDPKKPWKSQALWLYQALLAPLETQLRGKSQLILCPDGPLWDVPFAVLTNKQDTPLLERFSLSYANSATTWHAAQTARRKAAVAPRLLVLANPQFDAEKRFETGPSVPGQRPIVSPDRPIVSPDRPIVSPDRPIVSPDRPIVSPDRPIVSPDRDLFIPRGTRLVDLPGTQREADALAKRFPNATVYTRAKAQESVVKQDASKFQRIHLASHAFVNDAAPLLSSVVLANPTLDSGDDGFLTAREIFELDLSGVELVVLSACNTARGVNQGGEGVIGLTSALFAAGCPTQVLSQWAVDDSSTAILMTRFYDDLAKGASKGKSLRQAALSVRNEGKYTHPYFWAPFILIGDPR